MYLNVYYFLFQRKINNKKFVRGNIKRQRWWWCWKQQQHRQIVSRNLSPKESIGLRKEQKSVVEWKIIVKNFLPAVIVLRNFLKVFNFFYYLNFKYTTASKLIDEFIRKSEYFVECDWLLESDQLSWNLLINNLLLPLFLFPH